MTEAPPCEGPDPHPKTPSFVVPANACDCHAHIFGPSDQFAYTTPRSYTPPDASVSQYRHLLRTLGISRGVIVQPSVYGTDNRATANAIRELGQDFRGIAVVSSEATTSELERLHKAGFRGVRFNLLFEGGPDADELDRVADKIAGLGWHLQVLADLSQLLHLAKNMRQLPVPVVFDHMGHMPAATGIANEGFQTLLSLLRDDGAWVKLSGAYRTSGELHPPYGDVTGFAQALVDAAPDNCLWGTDWPHPSFGKPMPNDGDLMDMLPEWVPDEGMRLKILVDNPARLYGFE